MDSTPATCLARLRYPSDRQRIAATAVLVLVATCLAPASRWSQDLWVVVGAPTCALDVDGNGVAETATDVVYIERHLFGIPPVPPSFRISDPTITSDAAIVAQIDAVGPALDVDGNGVVEPARDVVYIARRLFGIPPVPPSFRSSDPTIPPDAVIASKIDGLCP